MRLRDRAALGVCIYVLLVAGICVLEFFPVKDAVIIRAKGAEYIPVSDGDCCGETVGNIVLGERICQRVLTASKVEFNFFLLSGTGPQRIGGVRILTGALSVYSKMHGSRLNMYRPCIYSWRRNTAAGRASHKSR